jgi:hypothetical protein
MPQSNLKVPVLAAVHTLLKPIGYRKSASVFISSVHDVVHLIEVQGSRSSTSDNAKFTVNVAVFAPALVYPDVRDTTKASVAGSHWRQRLGNLSPEHTDLWWEANSTETAHVAALDICQRIERYAVPALAKVASLHSLYRLWATGESPGVTALQRSEYLAQLAPLFCAPQNAG